MKIYQLAFAVKVYSIISENDMHFMDLYTKTGTSFSFSKDSHLLALLKWLRSWGCRQVPSEKNTKNIELAKSNLRVWYQRNKKLLPSKNVKLSDGLDEGILANIEKSYENLKEVVVLINKSNVNVRLGPTGASKTLFFLRQECLLPWDEPIRKEFKRKTYKQFLIKVQEEIRELQEDTKNMGLNPERIPIELGKPQVTLNKLIDEYNWIIYTRKAKVQIPDIEELKNWYKWAK